MSTMREQFEKWHYKEYGFCLREKNESYDGGQRERWAAWQAATEAAKATGTAGEVEHIHSPGEQADIGKRIRRVAKASGYVPDGTDEFYYAAAFAILGRAADALEQAARQPAQVVVMDESWLVQQILLFRGNGRPIDKESAERCARTIMAKFAATNRSQP